MSKRTAIVLLAEKCANSMVTLRARARTLPTAHGVHLACMQEQYGFAAKMRNQTIEQLKALETWVERQATGLDMAANPESLRQSFDKLLKVLI